MTCPHHPRNVGFILTWHLIISQEQGEYERNERVTAQLAAASKVAVLQRCEQEQETLIRSVELCSSEVDTFTRRYHQHQTASQALLQHEES